MSPTRKKMVDLWFRLRKPFATIVVSLLVAMGIVGASISASASDLLTVSQTQCASTGAADGAGTATVMVPNASPDYIYSVAWDGHQNDFSLTAGESKTISITNLVAGDHVVRLTAAKIGTDSGGPIAGATLHIDTCVVIPDPPPIPDPTVSDPIYGDWTGPEPTKENPTVVQTRTVSTITTTYTWEWNADTQQYDKVSHVGEPVFGEPETRTVTYEGPTPPDFPATIKVCGPNYTLPNWPGFTLEIVKEGPDVGHVMATRQADGVKRDYGSVPLGDCPVSPANPGDGGNPPSNGGGTPSGGGTTPSDDGATPVVDTSAASASDDGTSPLTGTDAPSTGGRGDTTSPLNGWIGGVILSIVAAGAVTGGIIKVRRRRA